jgi:hypothetical protein
MHILQELVESKASQEVLLTFLEDAFYLLKKNFLPESS